ncbi:MAG: L-alanine exporter AlaE [Candidatus Zambryskibacteria bacterium]|nr:L-alanine exporter AlaE [Candidatus Zambryskibacteria bacterium]
MKTKKFFVDVLALNLFIFCSAFFVEVFFSGISLGVFLKGRALMIIPNIITVEPYSRTRIWIGKKLGEWKSPRWHQITRDTLVFLLYRVPLVFLILTFLGAPVSKVLTACGVATLTAGFTGRPYGIFLDWMRRKCNV